MDILGIATEVQWQAEREEVSMTAVVTACAFCGGGGRDPFGLLSPLSTCQVCWGKGSVAISEPAITCAFCGGSGVHRDQRLTCTVCGGKGMVTVEEPRDVCPNCKGRGIAPGDYLPCLVCGGRGMVTTRSKVPQAT